MDNKKILRLASLIIICFFVSSCETLNIKPIEIGEQFTIEDDEKRLWKRAEEGQEVLNKSGFIYEDEQLTEYVNQVLDKLVTDYEKNNNVVILIKC